MTYYDVDIETVMGRGVSGNNATLKALENKQIAEGKFGNYDATFVPFHAVVGYSTAITTTPPISTADPYGCETESVEELQ